MSRLLLVTFAAAGASENAPCAKNSDCANGSCGHAERGAALICCPSGKRHFYGGRFYCSDLQGDQACWSDAMCASDKCFQGQCRHLEWCNGVAKNKQYRFDESASGNRCTNSCQCNGVRICSQWLFCSYVKDTYSSDTGRWPPF